MKSFFKRSLVLLGRRWVWTLLLTLAVALLVWFGGPLLAIAEYKPWEGPTARLASISALCLAWGAQVVFHNWRAATGRLNTQGNPDEQGRLRQLAAVGEARQVVRARFKGALRSLKTSSLYDGRGVQWRSELPWYLLIGPRDSGKTSLLDFSGVEFPLQASPRTLGQAVGSTEHCDWYFAENGVLIDTSGRYLEQPDAAIDSAAWRALLAMLRSRRRARPLNGVLLSVPVPLLQSADRAATVALGRTLRSRLQDIREALRINVPVYLVLTKADHLPGFDSFFDQLSREESEQVLGVSFTGDQQGSDPGTLNHEFEALLERLNAQVIQRMHQERDIGRRGEILTFPAQLADLSINLGYLVDATFTGNRYQPGFRLRGFYFTSAPHQGSAAASLGQSPALAQGYTGRSRFIHDLLVRVIFPEAQLAGLNVREARRITWGQRGLYAAALGCLVVFGAAWARSFSDNDRRLETLRGLAQEHHRAQGAQAPMDDASAVLAVLDTRYAATQVFSGQGGMALG